MGDIGILILFYNKLLQTIECINSFLPSGQRVYVLNNGSHPAQWKKLQTIFRDQPTISLLDAGKNLGVSGGRNYLINASTEEWLFAVDNDITIRPVSGWVKMMGAFLLTEPRARIICPAIYNVHEQAWCNQLRVNKRGNTVDIMSGHYAVTNCFPGGASIVHRSIFDQYGLWDDEMFVGFEDYEFALRAMVDGSEGLKAFSCISIELVHDHQFQRSLKDKEAVRQRYNEEKLKVSYERIVKKHAIVFEHEWQWWCRKQVSDMTKIKHIQLLKRRVRKLLGK